MTNYFDYPLESDSVTHQQAKKEFEYWKEIFEDEIQDNYEKWKFYKNPFLTPEDYAYDILSDDEKRAFLN
ncbi:MAG: hypothetical protein CBB97_25625 [Candidatus Endolissoclinum sp. TMED37]|nr:MAG: hypothetical protein CBB97_25625 [Candidatus Endolissoclinum sp. TMED37]|tara:strand:- start:1 stop:210 length:210 start_codon:yes stop_codon:yes gene_type:complete